MTVVCESGNLVCAMLAGIGVHQTSLRCHENSLLVPVQVNKSLIFVYVVTSISFMQNYKHDILIALQKRNEVPSSYHGIVKKEKKDLEPRMRISGARIDAQIQDQNDHQKACSIHI